MLFLWSRNTCLGCPELSGSSGGTFLRRLDAVMLLAQALQVAEPVVITMLDVVNLVGRSATKTPIRKLLLTLPAITLAHRETQLVPVGGQA